MCAFFFKLSFVPACGIIILENVGINSEALTKNDGKALYFDAYNNGDRITALHIACMI